MKKRETGKRQNTNIFCFVDINVRKRHQQQDNILVSLFTSDIQWRSSILLNYVRKQENRKNSSRKRERQEKGKIQTSIALLISMSG